MKEESYHNCRNSFYALDIDNNYSIKYRKNKALRKNSNIINANYIYSIENDKFLSMIDIYTGSIVKIIIIEFPEFPGTFDVYSTNAKMFKLDHGFFCYVSSSNEINFIYPNI